MANTTSYRVYGDKKTAMALRYPADMLLARVKQEMSWNKIPHLKRAFIIHPCALSPLGAEVVISSCYGVDNIHVYVPLPNPMVVVPQPEVIERVFLHLKIYSKDHAEDRTGYSLVWDIENNRFPTSDFGISGIVATDTLAAFMAKTTNDSSPLFEVEDGVLFNDLLQNRVVKWSESENIHYHVPALLEYMENDEHPYYDLYLQNVGGVITDLYGWPYEVSIDTEYLTDCGDWSVETNPTCLRDIMFGEYPDPEYPTAEEQAQLEAYQYWWHLYGIYYYGNYNDTGGPVTLQMVEDASIAYQDAIAAYNAAMAIYNAYFEAWVDLFEAWGSRVTNEKFIENLPWLKRTSSVDANTNDQVRPQVSGTKCYDGTVSNVRAIWLSPSFDSSWERFTWLPGGSGAADYGWQGDDNYKHFLDGQTYHEHTNTVIVERAHYLTAFFYFQDYFFHLYNSHTPALHDCIKAPILPSFSLKAKATSEDKTNFNVKLTSTYSEEVSEYEVRSRFPPDDPNIDYYKWENTLDTYSGNKNNKTHNHIWEFFTPLGSIGTIESKVEQVEEYSKHGDLRELDFYDDEIKSIDSEILNVKFFWGRPSYLGAYSRKGIAQIYAYDFNYHDITAYPVMTNLGSTLDGKFYPFRGDCFVPNYDNQLWMYPHFTSVQTVESAMVKGNRQLIVGASASTNPGTPLTEMTRNPDLEQAVKDLFDTYYEENELPLTTVDEDYKVELEIVTLKKERD
jgi:hypothetical protein